jgi:epoxide hydrolase-like predicted phosphatase
MVAIQVIVFDIGGILEIVPGGVDPAARFPEMFAKWEVRLGMQPGELSARLEKVDERLNIQEGEGTYTEEEWQSQLRLVTEMDQDQFAAFLDDFWDTYMGTSNDELIAYFRSLRPRYRTALLSNSFVGARSREQEHYHFDEMTDLIIYSHEEGIAKPDQRIFLLACERLGVQPAEMVFLDDTEPNIASARACGIQAILFKDTAQAIADIQACLQADH